MESAATATTTALTGAALNVVLWLSDVVFRWIPATISVLVGYDEATLDGADHFTQPPDGPNEPTVTLEATPYVSTTTTTGQPTSYEFPTGGYTTTQEPRSVDEVALPGFIADAWDVFVPLSIFISLLLATGVVYAVIRVVQIRMREYAVQRVVEQPVATGSIPKVQQRWERIVAQANSENDGEWRAAILEADIMLDELLEVQGYHGETMADKMKQVERSDFNTIDLAWEAHKVRNRVAHKGAAHDLSQREVRRVIGLYEQVFREFHFI